MAKIRERLRTEPELVPGKTGQFDVIADGQPVAKRGGNWLTRSFGAGYPDLDELVRLLESRKSA